MDGEENEMEKNPFTTLGIDPSVVSGLTDDQIEILIRGVAKTLQKICHPDKTNNKTLRKRSNKINLAIEQLNREKYPEGFDYWKKKFLTKSSMKKKTERTNLEIEKLSQNLNRICLQNVDLLKNKFFSHLLIPFELTNKTIRLHNTWLISQNNYWIPFSKENVRHSFFEYKLNEEGRVVCIGNKKINTDKVIIGAIDDGIFSNFLIKEIKVLYKNLKRERLMMSNKAKADKKTSYRGPIITKEQYKIIAPYIKCKDIKIGNYIVSINYTIDNDIYFQIDGSLKKGGNIF